MSLPEGAMYLGTQSPIGSLSITGWSSSPLKQSYDSKDGPPIQERIQSIVKKKALWSRRLKIVPSKRDYLVGGIPTPPKKIRVRQLG